MQRPANVQITQTINGQKSVMYLCESCAGARQDLIMNSTFNMSNLLSSIMENLQGITQVPVKEITLQCEICGMTYEEFTHMGKFGCRNCYNAFGSKLIPIFRRVHGNTKHTGKVPAKYRIEKKTAKEISSLKLQLEQSIRDEQYEKAAQLRDRIRFLENEQRKAGDSK
jgi:protein arginine kinase activator